MTALKPANYYAVPELAAAYDADSEARQDLPFYLSLAGALGARRVADIGAGTGLLCSLLAGQRHEVIGVEPEETMLSLAASQPHAGTVTWIQGTAENLPDAWTDLVLMTGHVAQYFLNDTSWVQVLTHARRALRPGGRLAFEVRNPDVEAWRRWEGTHSTSRGTVTQTVQREDDRISHTDTWTDGSGTRTTTETLRFPAWNTVTAGLQAAGFTVDQCWGNWDGSPVRQDSPEWIYLTEAV
ncbi:class I SAM-dependent methyltransferase [Arthrobacter sp. zg-Y826]|uniref:class I SAM-dependent methyltransferase n=1 Tax=Arthrobacter jinronghuae TaxID=2964609 RepID=UPI002103BB37|nr:methyltransferase domain-containing protein [Arthrobacter jinronghuae]MCQ1956471.1 class I SAM-dependent methyltransferase [Arthrobacter jinronghuae]